MSDFECDFSLSDSDENETKAPEIDLSDELLRLTDQLISRPHHVMERLSLMTPKNGTQIEFQVVLLEFRARVCLGSEVRGTGERLLSLARGPEAREHLNNALQVIIHASRDDEALQSKLVEFLQHPPPDGAGNAFREAQLAINYHSIWSGGGNVFDFKNDLDFVLLTCVEAAIRSPLDLKVCCSTAASVLAEACGASPRGDSLLTLPTSPERVPPLRHGGTLTFFWAAITFRCIQQGMFPLAAAAGSRALDSIKKLVNDEYKASHDLAAWLGPLILICREIGRLVSWNPAEFAGSSWEDTAARRMASDLQQSVDRRDVRQSLKLVEEISKKGVSVPLNITGHIFGGVYVSDNRAWFSLNCELLHRWTRGEDSERRESLVEMESIIRRTQKGLVVIQPEEKFQVVETLWGNDEPRFVHNGKSKWGKDFWTAFKIGF